MMSIVTATFPISEKIHHHGSAISIKWTAAASMRLPVTRLLDPVNGMKPSASSCTGSGSGCISMWSICPRPIRRLMCPVLFEAKNVWKTPVIRVE